MLVLLLPGHHPVGRLLEQRVSALPASHFSLLRQASLRHGSGYNAKPLKRNCNNDLQIPK